MNRNIICFCIGVMFLAGMPLCAQQKSTATAKTESKHGRIERVKEKGQEVIRFFNKDGKKNREIRLETKDTKVRISKSKKFSPAGFPVSISTRVAEVIENARKVSGRDIELYRRESHWSSLSGNGKFVSITDDYADFVEAADAMDGERAEEATETVNATSIYDYKGNKILELDREDGWQPVVSNTGQYFVVTLGEYEKSRLINKDKKVLAEFEGAVAPVFFSKSDRYVLLVHFDPQADSEKASLTVYDTQTNQLELKKISLLWSVFSSNEIPEINEEARTMIVYHDWDSIAKESKIDTVHF